ncbi:MAG: dihydrodipicolinate synthase family protein [Planctomycetes bacterium]|nr:dihydrodipicolinate synthase family protein [Planctomycetota bacterium]
MDRKKTQSRIRGCYIPLPTLFRDDDLELNLPGMRRHVRFLLDGGVREGNGVLLVCGAAGEFTTLTTDERLHIAAAVLDEAGDKVSVILGAQGTSPRELHALARGASRLGVVALQVSPPFYHVHTDDDVYEFMEALAGAADIGLVFYTTYWQYRLSMELIGRVLELPGVVALKLAAASVLDFERSLRLFAGRTMVIDNQLDFVRSHMLGGQGINVHPSNYWPQWGIRLWELLEAKHYLEAQQQMTRAIAPYYDLASDIEKYTGGEGHLDKLCLELVGLDSSRCRPPIRDIRPRFREAARQMLRDCGVPGVT